MVNMYIFSNILKYFREDLEIIRNLKSFSISELEKRCVLGDLDACYVLGIKYDIGNGVLINYLKATNLIEKAAERGHVESQIYLSSMFLSGCYDRSDAKFRAYAWASVASVLAENEFLVCKAKRARIAVGKRMINIEEMNIAQDLSEKFLDEIKIRDKSVSEEDKEAK